MSKRKMLEELLEAREDRSCALLCLDIIDFCSSLTGDEINELLTDKTVLGDLDLSATQCERCVRGLINDKIRVPAGKPKLPRGSVTPNTNVLKLITDSCK